MQHTIFFEFRGSKNEEIEVPVCEMIVGNIIAEVIAFVQHSSS